jgi:hypothetical protein
MDFESVLVDITTKGQNGTSMQTQLTLKRLAFSQFTQFIDRWDRNVQMHDDEIIGRFHSNSRFQVLYDPRPRRHFRSGHDRRRGHRRGAHRIAARSRGGNVSGRLESAPGALRSWQARPLIDDALEPRANAYRFWWTRT